MQVRAITLAGFMRYQAQVELKLPPVGLVLITGQNGAGKSSFVEAVSYAAWGKTLRGTDPRQANTPGYAQVELEFGMVARRAWGSGMRSALEVSLQDKVFQFDTVTKAQEHVTSVLGEWDTWRRSCAFSSVDDLSFATATDAERKRLLESLIGLSRFDLAQVACRDKLRNASAEHDLVATELVRVRTRLAATTEALGTLEAMAATAAPSTDPAAIAARLEAVQANLTMRVTNRDNERASYQASIRGLAAWEAQVNQVRARLTALDRTPVSDTCSTCGQTWPDAAQKANHRETQRIKFQHELDALLVEPHKGSSPDRYNAAEQALASCQNAIHQLQTELTVAQQAHRRYAEAQATVKEVKGHVVDLEDAEAVAQIKLDALAYEVRHLAITDTVLGTKGARAHMLTDALVGVENVANLWLERIARVDAPLKLKLAPYTEKKTGGTADAISLEVEGAGGGRGYRAASGGERRRIDVAIMLALAEVAQAASGRVCPTLFFDEVFDSLDTAGVAAVARTLDELAQDRCVVVLSHNEELIANLVPDIRLHVGAGGMVEHK